MNDFQWLEPLSWAANVALAVIALLALRQVQAAIRQANSALEQNRLALEQLKITAAQLEVSRADITIRSKREAVAFALDQCKRFAECILPQFDQLTPEMINRGYQPPNTIDPDFPFISPKQDPISAKVFSEGRDLRLRIFRSLNELESFAMYFACDLADEGVAFTPTAQSFCTMCEFFRFFIGTHRQPNQPRLYQNLVKLYAMWKPRLHRNILEEQGKFLESQKQKLPADKRGTPLGTDF